MFIGIVGLEAESFIRLLRYSHTHYKNNKKTKSIYNVRYEKYQYFVGHPQLAHGGYGSLPTRGLRLHGYHGFPASVQLDSYPVDWNLFDNDSHLDDIRGTRGHFDKGVPAGEFV